MHLHYVKHLTTAEVFMGQMSPNQKPQNTDGKMVYRIYDIKTEKTPVKTKPMPVLLYVTIQLYLKCFDTDGRHREWHSSFTKICSRNHRKFPTEIILLQLNL